MKTEVRFLFLTVTCVAQQLYKRELVNNKIDTNVVQSAP